MTPQQPFRERLSVNGNRLSVYHIRITDNRLPITGTGANSGRSKHLNDALLEDK